MQTVAKARVLDEGVRSRRLPSGRRPLGRKAKDLERIPRAKRHAAGHSDGSVGSTATSASARCTGRSRLVSGRSGRSVDERPARGHPLVERLGSVHVQERGGGPARSRSATDRAQHVLEAAAARPPELARGHAEHPPRRARPRHAREPRRRASASPSPPSCTRRTWPLPLVPAQSSPISPAAASSGTRTRSTPPCRW